MIEVVEVGPRDGLQNEPQTLKPSLKKKYIEKLVETGIRSIEIGSFVRPDFVPQMADTATLYRTLPIAKWEKSGIKTWSLVPNHRGFERALQAGAKGVALFTAVTDGFAQRNIRMSVKESLAIFADLAREAKKRKIRVRGYVSTVFGCPYEGEVKPSKALKVIDRLADLGVDQISLGDTIGVANPKLVEKIVGKSIGTWGNRRIAVHFHDTRGLALANVLKSVELGAKIIDSSSGGMGGCPYAPGASGNVATEDVVYMLNGLGLNTGIDVNQLCEVSLWMAKQMGRDISSKYVQAYAAQRSAGRKKK